MNKTERIENIRIFLRNTGITSRSLENELTDHIATACEEKMEEGEDFYNAFKSTVAKFGPHGFQKIQRNFNRYFHWNAIKLFLRNFAGVFNSGYVFPAILLITISFFFAPIYIENFQHLQLSLIFFNLFVILMMPFFWYPLLAKEGKSSGALWKIFINNVILFFFGWIVLPLIMEREKILLKTINLIFFFYYFTFFIAWAGFNLFVVESNLSVTYMEAGFTLFFSLSGVGLLASHKTIRSLMKTKKNLIFS